jgi:hypothetical protein
MARRLSMGQDEYAVEGGVGLARLASVAPAVVIALVLAMAAVGGAFIGRQGSPWGPAWETIDDNATSHPSADRVGAGGNDPGRSERANDDGYLEGVARALGYDSVEQMARGSRPQAPSNLVHR